MSELAPLGSHPEPLSPGASQLRSSLLGGNGGWEREQSSLPTRMGGHSVSHLTSFQSASVMGSFATQLQRVTGVALPDWPDVSLAGQTTLANCSENHVLPTPSQMRSIKKFRDLWALMESRCGPQCQRGRESGEVMSGPGHGHGCPVPAVVWCSAGHGCDLGTEGWWEICSFLGQPCVPSLTGKSGELTFFSR